MKPAKLIITVVIVLVALIITGFIVREIFHKVVHDITEREIARITQGVTEGEVEKITQEITEKEITGRTNRIIGIDAQLQEVDCDTTPTPRRFASAPYYGGPLFDDHLHMPLTFDVPKAIYAQADWDGPILEKDVPASQIICVLDNSKTRAAIGFYVVPNLLKDRALQQLKAVDTKYPGRIQPFLMPAHVSGLDLKLKEYEEIITAHAGLFKCIGEFAFYKGSLKGIAPDDSSFMELYALAGQHDLIVMIHPDQGQQQAIENILQTNPKVTFLFHGQEIGPYISNIVSKYPNAYYSIDADLSDIPNEGNSVNLYGSDSKEKFISDYNRDHDKILTGAIAMWKSPIEKNPDKFLWGTDRAFDWHFDPEVGAMLEEMGREFIGKLDPSVQEKVAYKNAERMLEKE